MKIACIDSGMGGLFIVQKLFSDLPAHYLYYADTAYMPYGNKTSDQIITRVKVILTTVLLQKPDIVVIACFSASVFAEFIMQHYPGLAYITMLDLVPLLSINKHHSIVGLIATQATISSGNLFRILQKNYPDKTIVSQACPALASALEHNASQSHIRHLLNTYCTTLYEQNVSCIVLGCTHYEVLINYKNIVNNSISLYNFSHLLLGKLKIMLSEGPKHAKSHLKLFVTGLDSLVVYDAFVKKNCTLADYASFHLPPS